MLHLIYQGDPKLLNGDYILSNSLEYPIMAARLLIVRHLPVSGILTTNYDQLLCFCDAEKRKKNPCSVAKVREGGRNAAESREPRRWGVGGRG